MCFACAKKPAAKTKERVKKEMIIFEFDAMAIIWLVFKIIIKSAHHSGNFIYNETNMIITMWFVQIENKHVQSIIIYLFKYLFKKNDHSGKNHN